MELKRVWERERVLLPIGHRINKRWRCRRKTSLVVSTTVFHVNRGMAQKVARWLTGKHTAVGCAEQPAGSSGWISS
jgi:hypothetical protein